MKVNLKRGWNAAVLILALILVITACSSNKKTESGESPDPSASQTASQSASAEDSNVSLTVWVGGLADDNQIAGAQESAKKEGKTLLETDTAAYIAVTIKEEFMKKYPNVTEIKFQNRGWTEELSSNLQRAVLAGVGPDVVAGESQVADFARLGAFREIDIDEMKDDIIEGTIRSAIVDGKVYGLALKTGTLALQYNRDVLRKYGYDPDKDIPKTWDELLKISQDITARGKGENYGFMVDAVPGLGSMFRFHPLLLQLGINYGTDQGEATFDSPAHIKAYEFARALSQTSPPGATAMTDENQALQVVHTGKAAFQFDGPWQIDWAKQNKCDCGYARLPLPEGGKTGNTIIGNAIYSVLRDTKHPVEAEAFVKFLGSPEGQAIQMKVSSILPTNRKALELVPDFFTRFPEMQVFFDEVDQAENLSPIPTYTKNNGKIHDEWTLLKDQILNPKTNIADAAKNAQKQAEELLK